MPALEARFLLESLLNISSSTILLGEYILTEEEYEKIWQVAERRRAGEPLGRILGEREFWGLNLHLSPAILEPRPDSETLVEAVLRALRQQGKTTQALTLLDLGTGSGALLLALLKELPCAVGYGGDNEAAVLVAQRNAWRNHLHKRAHFFVGSWGEALRPQPTFEVIVSNPPYIATHELSLLPFEVRQYDPILALDGGADGLEAYRHILHFAYSALQFNGLIALEMGYTQGRDLGALLEASGFKRLSLHQDLNGLDRVLLAEKRL